MPDQHITLPYSSGSSFDARTSAELLANAIGQHLSECYATETKTLSNGLLTLGVVLVLLATGAIEIGSEGTLAGVKLPPKAKGILVVTGALIALFLTAIYGSRCYIEWSAWRLRNQAVDWKITEIHEALMEAENLRIADSNRIAQEVRTRYESGERSQSLNRRSEEILQPLEGREAKDQAQVSEMLHTYLSRAVVIRHYRLHAEAILPSLFVSAIACYSLWTTL